MKLSFIIVEYNSLDEIRKCIRAIEDTIKCNYEVIISSNSNYSYTKQKTINIEFPQCKWVFNEYNGGFAYAMNRGMSISSGDFLTIMNPDCKIIQGIENMVSFLQKNDNIGAIAPKIIDSEYNMQDICRKYVSIQSFIIRQIRRIITRKECILDKSFDYNKIQTVDWVIGAFIMVTRKAYERTGGMSEDYFMYAEDLDWCTRIRKSGLEIVYYPKAIVEYKGTRSARKSKKFAKIFLKSHLIYWEKFGFIYGYPKRKQIIFKG